MVVIRDYSGIPCPHCGPPLSIHAGDVIELMFADLHSSWWQVRVTQLIFVSSQHLWLYEKITCYGSPGWLGARNVFAVMGLNLRGMSSLLSDKDKSLYKMWTGWHQQFLSLWPLLFLNHQLNCSCLSHSVSCQVSHKYDIMMRSVLIRKICWRSVWTPPNPSYITGYLSVLSLLRLNHSLHLMI